MRVTYTSPVKPGDTIVIGGWVLLWEDTRNREVFGGLFPTNSAAIQYARASMRGRNWRVLPCTGHVSSHDAAIRQDGTVEMVIM